MIVIDKKKCSICYSFNISKDIIIYLLAIKSKHLYRIYYSEIYLNIYLK